MKFVQKSSTEGRRTPYTMGEETEIWVRSSYFSEVSLFVSWNLFVREINLKVIEEVINEVIEFWIIFATVVVFFTVYIRLECTVEEGFLVLSEREIEGNLDIRSVKSCKVTVKLAVHILRKNPLDHGPACFEALGKGSTPTYLHRMGWMSDKVSCLEGSFECSLLVYAHFFLCKIELTTKWKISLLSS